MSVRRIARRGVAACLAIASTCLAVATAGGATAEAHASGTVTVAFPGGSPTQIFPFLTCAQYDVRNVQEFQKLMYRPLYWFGLGASTGVQFGLSPASSPAASSRDTSFTIHLKGWRFSDGQTVDAESVAFFLNLYKSDPTGFCGYTEGYGLPDAVTSVSYPDGLTGDTVVLKLTRSVNPTWFLDDELSQITPMPEAWDVSGNGQAAGAGGCASAVYGSATAATDCSAVHFYLGLQSDNPSLFPGSMWQTVDGPWTLRTFSDTGTATFAPNRAYSGPQVPPFATLVERQYAHGGDLADLKAGNLQLGYVSPSLLPSDAPAPGVVGRNLAVLASRYVLTTSPTWGISDFTINFHASDGSLDEVEQPYLRQALQAMVPQSSIIRQFYAGYATPTCGPLPFDTPSSIARISCPLAYDPRRARALLLEHGWRIERGIQTCVRPGTTPSDCGAGIERGQQLVMKLQGLIDEGPTMAAIVQRELDAEATIGIDVESVIVGFPMPSPCAPTYAMCELGDWHGVTDFYPTGESLFTSHGQNNVGGYSDGQMTSLITESTTRAGSLTAYARFAASQVPVLYEPEALRVYEVSRSLRCVVPGACAQSPLGDFMPEYFR